MTVIYPHNVYGVRPICEALAAAGFRPRFHASTLCITVPAAVEDLPAEATHGPYVAAVDHP